MIDRKTVESIHNILIDKFGGGKGLRDNGALEAALARPYATFDQKDLYPTAVDKAAAIFESIIINHPFIDGNKRTAYMKGIKILWIAFTMQSEFKIPYFQQINILNGF